MGRVRINISVFLFFFSALFLLINIIKRLELRTVSIKSAYKFLSYYRHIRNALRRKEEKYFSLISFLFLFLLNSNSRHERVGATARLCRGQA